MASKKVLGIDIGTNRMKLVLMEGSHLLSNVEIDLPDKLVQDGRIVSIETVGELIKNALKENNMNVNKASIVLNGDNVFVRTMTMPVMTQEQLLYNIPFEFKDYITEELKDYVYDFAMISTPEQIKEQEGDNKTMEILASACPSHLIEEYKAMVRKAGLSLSRLAPYVSAYTGLIHQLDDKQEYCFVDIGYESIRIHIFTGDAYSVTRKVEIGMKDMDALLADHFNVDVHLAHTYFVNNYEDCQNSEVCTSAFENITVELTRALNFYRFNNPESQLNDIYLCGGGSMIENLVKIITQRVDLNVHDVSHLQADANAFNIQAIGIALE